jgi:hypothetical protein
MAPLESPARLAISRAERRRGRLAELDEGSRRIAPVAPREDDASEVRRGNDLWMSRHGN